MAFEEQMAAVNAAVVSGLANAEVVIGASSRARVLFDRAYVDVLGVASTTPAMRMNECDLGGLQNGDLVAIGADDFRVISIEPDGAGMALVRLEVQS